MLFKKSFGVLGASKVFKLSNSLMEVEIVSDAALKLRYCKLTVTRTDVYGRILLVFSVNLVCKEKLTNHLPIGCAFRPQNNKKITFMALLEPQHLDERVHKA